MNSINWDAYRFVFDILQTLFMALLGVYAWWTNRSHVTTSAIEQVEAKVSEVKASLEIRVNKLDRRLGTVEQEVKHLPDHEDIGDIHEKVNQVATTMSQMQGELAGINRTLGLINEYLLNQGGKK